MDLTIIPKARGKLSLEALQQIRDGHLNVNPADRISEAQASNRQFYSKQKTHNKVESFRGELGNVDGV